MIKLKDILKESIGGLVTIPAINPPMNYEEKKPKKKVLEILKHPALSLWKNYPIHRENISVSGILTSVGCSVFA